MSKRYDARDAARRASSTGTGAAIASTVVQTPIHVLRTSPFQPAGRPSEGAVTAVRTALDEMHAALTAAHTLENLFNLHLGQEIFAQLPQEAARLAELAYDISIHGVKTALEARRTPGGELELISGHRRLAAATLAGLAMVPVIDRGAMDDATAEGALFGANLHREDFTTIQAARLVASLQQRRQAAGYQDTVRTLAQLMGTSNGRVGTLQQIARAVPPPMAARLGGDEVLSALSYRKLERLVAEPDDRRREALARQLLGLDAQEQSPVGQSSVVHRPRRGGGFCLQCSEPVEALAHDDAALLRELLAAQLTRVTARLAALAAASA